MAPSYSSPGVPYTCASYVIDVPEEYRIPTARLWVLFDCPGVTGFIRVDSRSSQEVGAILTNCSVVDRARMLVGPILPSTCTLVVHVMLSSIRSPLLRDLAVGRISFCLNSGTGSKMLKGPIDVRIDMTDTALATVSLLMPKSETPALEEEKPDTSDIDTKRFLNVEVRDE